MVYSLFISCPKGIEYLLEEEVRALGLTVTKVKPQGVYGETTELATVYQLCLWSRLANRIHLILFQGNVENDRSLYRLCREFPWLSVFNETKSIAVEFHGASTHFRNSLFGAQVIKDGVVDYFREVTGVRPSVDRNTPDIRLHAFLKHDEITVSLDLVGYSLHQRGYRTETGQAPLKENLAAALLIRAKWPSLTEKNYTLQDPFCGSGTLVIEAAMMAGQRAPGLLRDDQRIIHWIGHDEALWHEERMRAAQQAKPLEMILRGSDSDEKLIDFAKSNARRAGFVNDVEFTLSPVVDSRPNNPQGLVLCNPPYGERLGELTQWIPLYQQLGEMLHTFYQGWEAYVLTSTPVLAKALGLRSYKQYTLFNGALECKLYCFHLDGANQLKTTPDNTGVEMFVNRLKKNCQHLDKWAKRNNISCYRVYDADLPEYAFAIDRYNDYAVLQEYAAPSTIPLHKVERRTLEVMQTVPSILNISSEKLVMKKRQQQKGRQQYEKMDYKNTHIIVNEGKALFKVNLYDYLDTGLFLDHRLMRFKFGRLQPPISFLNCFCYTGSASIHAALAGAETTNIDLSNTYLEWARSNFRLNKLDLHKHRFIQADCLQWLQENNLKFNVIFLDPPSFSNSKRMDGTLDIQRDHVPLIKAAMKGLTMDGTLYFSTHRKGFKLDQCLFDLYHIAPLANETLDLDFKRSKGIHICFKISFQKT